MHVDVFDAPLPAGGDVFDKNGSFDELNAERQRLRWRASSRAGGFDVGDKFGQQLVERVFEVAAVGADLQ